MEARNFARSLAVDSALFQVGALIARYLTQANAQLGFELTVFPVKLQNKQRAAGDLREPVSVTARPGMRSRPNPMRRSKSPPINMSSTKSAFATGPFRRFAARQSRTG